MASVLITGSSRGLGKSLANIFARNNYEIILHGRDENLLLETMDEIKKINSSVSIVQGDLRDDSTLNLLYDKAKKNNLSVLINNAGALCPGTPLEEITENQIDDLLTTNLYAPIKLTQKIYNLFSQKNEGTIININSMIGLEIKKLRTVSCAAKWGFHAFSNSLKLETAGKRIRILDVYPTRIKTTQEYSVYGMNPDDVAEKIYKTYNNTSLDRLVIDGRPKNI